MIISGQRLLGTPVMSLQTGSEVAKTERAIIDPQSLAVIAYGVSGAMIHGDTGSIMTLNDVREISDIGFIIDSVDELVMPDDIIKLKTIYDMRFELISIKVLDEKHKKIGRVSNYTLDTGSFVIQQLTVKRPLLQSLNDTELIIHRSQIIEISKDAIVVHSEAKIPEPARHEVAGSYVNPFRNSRPASDAATPRF